MRVLRSILTLILLFWTSAASADKPTVQLGDFNSAFREAMEHQRVDGSAGVKFLVVEFAGTPIVYFWPKEDVSVDDLNHIKFWKEIKEDAWSGHPEKASAAIELVGGGLVMVKLSPDGTIASFELMPESTSLKEAGLELAEKQPAALTLVADEIMASFEASGKIKAGFYIRHQGKPVIKSGCIADIARLAKEL